MACGPETGRALFLASAILVATPAVLASVALSQAQDASASSAPNPTPGAPVTDESKPVKPDGEPKKAKKVWTNENLGDAKGAVTQSGETKVSAAAKTAPAKQASPQFVANVRRQLQKMQAQLADIEKQIRDLDAFNKGEVAGGSGGMKLHKSYGMEPIDQQIQKLQGNKRQIEARIDALLDEARKNGVESGQLP